MSLQKTIFVNDISLCNENSFVLIGGLNVLETKDLALKVAETFKKVTSRLQIPYIFKASFDKANRSSMESSVKTTFNGILCKTTLQCNPL